VAAESFAKYLACQFWRGWLGRDPNSPYILSTCCAEGRKEGREGMLDLFSVAGEDAGGGRSGGRRHGHKSSPVVIFLIPHIWLASCHS
jgi:hypothetical protein